MALILFLLLIAGIIIYYLNGKVEDDKLIKSNYIWKERIRSLEDLIEHLESKVDELRRKGMLEEINKNEEKIKAYSDEIKKLNTCICNNEKYLKEKGRI